MPKRINRWMFDRSLATRQYVDDAVPTNMMTTDTAQTVTAVKTFSNAIVGSITGSAGSATKATQDSDGKQINTTYAKLASPALTGTPTAPTAATATNNTQIATTAFVKAQGYITISGSTPVGTILLFAGSSVPTGYLLCNGANVSRTTYAALFAIISTKYGTGDGSTTFTLPNMNNRYPIGAGTNTLGTQLAEQLPNVTGTIVRFKNDAYVGTDASVNGVFSISGNKGNAHLTAGTSGSFGRSELYFKAASSSSIYKNSGKVYPLSLALNYVIKY